MVAQNDIARKMGCERELLAVAMDNVLSSLDSLKLAQTKTNKAKPSKSKKK